MGGGGIEDAVVLETNAWDFTHFGHLLVKVLPLFWYLFDVRYKHIYIPQQSSENIAYLRVIDAIKNNVPTTYNYDKIFLSRKYTFNAHNKTSHTIFGEEQIAKIFENNGFKIIYPEEHSIMEQISLMKSCKVLAGIGGSGMHQSIFMDNKSEVINLFRNYTYNGFYWQFKIDRMREHKITYIDCCIEPFPHIEFNDPNWIDNAIGLTCFLEQFFKEHNFVYEKNMVNNREIMLDYLTNFGEKYSQYRYGKWWIEPSSPLLYDVIKQLKEEIKRQIMKNVMNVRALFIFKKENKKLFKKVFRIKYELDK